MPEEPEKDIIITTTVPPLPRLIGPPVEVDPNAGAQPRRRVRAPWVQYGMMLLAMMIMIWGSQAPGILSLLLSLNAIVMFIGAMIAVVAAIINSERLLQGR